MYNMNKDIRGIQYMKHTDIESYEKDKTGWLNCKKEIIANIPYESLGFGYTVSHNVHCNSNSFDNIEYEEQISEYIFLKSKRMNILGKLEDYISYLQFFDMISYSNIRKVEEEQSEKYKSELKEMGYIELPEWFSSLSDDELIELFEHTKKK